MNGLVPTQINHIQHIYLETGLDISVTGHQPGCTSLNPLIQGNDCIYEKVPWTLGFQINVISNLCSFHSRPCARLSKC